MEVFQTREKLCDPRAGRSSPATVSVLIPGQTGRMVSVSIKKSMEITGEKKKPNPDFLLQVMTCIKNFQSVFYTQ